MGVLMRRCEKLVGDDAASLSLSIYSQVKEYLRTMAKASGLSVSLLKQSS